MKNPIISVVLGSYNRIKFLPLAINSIREEFYNFLPKINYEIIVVDGGSDDGSLEWLCEQKDIITVVQHNRGDWLGKEIERKSWGYFMNLVFKMAQGKYICMVSDDCILVPGAIKNGYDLFEQKLKEKKKVGALAFYWRESFLEEAYKVGMPAKKIMYVNHGMYLRSALQEVNYIDEDTYNFYFADIDLCFRLWDAGYEILDSPDSYLEHYPHANVNVRKSNKKDTDHDYKKFLARWTKKIPELTTRNLGDLKKKKFFDKAMTCNRFKQEHEVVLKTHPKLFQGPVWNQELYGAIKWRVRAVRKKIKEGFWL